MKTGINLRCFRERFSQGMTLDAALDQCAEWGAEQVVIPWGAPGKPAAGLLSHDSAYLSTLVSEIRQRGLEVAAFWICNDFAYNGAGDWREQQINATQNLLRLSAELHIPDLHLWTGRYQKNASPEQMAAQEQLVRDAFADCAPIAASSGVRLAVENHIDIFPQAADLVALCQQFGPAVSICPNPALWGIRLDKEKFFAVDAAIHQHVRNELLIAAPHMTLVNLGIWGGTDTNASPNPSPWGEHWQPLKEIFQQLLEPNNCCCLQTYTDGDLIDPILPALAALT